MMKRGSQAAAEPGCNRKEALMDCNRLTLHACAAVCERVLRTREM